MRTKKKYLNTKKLTNQTQFDEESSGTAASAKGTAEAGLKGVTYRPPVQKPTSCLGGCTARRGSMVRFC
jgi:hypothetical protein